MIEMSDLEGSNHPLFPTTMPERPGILVPALTHTIHHSTQFSNIHSILKYPLNFKYPLNSQMSTQFSNIHSVLKYPLNSQYRHKLQIIAQFTHSYLYNDTNAHGQHKHLHPLVCGVEERCVNPDDITQVGSVFGWSKELRDHD